MTETTKRSVGMVATGAAALVVLGLLGATHVVGGKIETEFKDGLNRLNQPQVQVALTRYERGWFSSTAESRWTLTGEAPQVFTATHQIRHGPLAGGKFAKVLTAFAMPADTDAVLMKALADQSPLTIASRVGWSGKSDHTLRSPALVMEEAGTRIDWGGIQGEFELSSAMDAVKGRFDLPKLMGHWPMDAADGDEDTNASADEVAVDAGDGAANRETAVAQPQTAPDGSEKLTLHVQQVSLTMDARQAPGHAFWLGSADMHVGNLDVRASEAGVDPIALKGLRWDSQTELKDALVFSDNRLSLSEGRHGDNAAQDVQLDIAMRRVSPQMMDLLASWGDALEDEAKGQALQLAFAQALPQALRHQPEVEVTKASMNTVHGPVTLRSLVGYVGTDPNAFDPLADLKQHLNVSMPTQLLQAWIAAKARQAHVALLAHSDLSAEESELQAVVQEAVPQVMADLNAAGMLVQQGDQVRMDVRIEAGQVQLNGKRLEGQDMLKAISGMAALW